MDTLTHNGTLTVGEVARTAGITVRTLHHYDELGLLTPSRRGANGYRLYEPDDLGRLQRILFYRELELPLDRIRSLLDGDQGPLEHLQRQRELLLDQRARLDRLVLTLEQTMSANKMGIDLTPEEMLEVFGDQDPSRYADEAEERYGGTEAWEQSTRRAASYTKDDWKRIVADNERFLEQLAETMRAGEPADGELAMDLAEQARLGIDHLYYECTHARHRTLATMYVTDPRFAATYERVAEGLAMWFRDAIHANAARHGVTEDGW